MRALVQRVTKASVSIDGEIVGLISQGLCVLVGVTHDDDDLGAKKLAKKIWELRIFSDDAGLMNLAAADISAEILLISQFTLYGDTRKGRRPSWIDASRPEHAAPLVDAVAAELRALGAHVETGRFGADMAVELINDGPVTLMLEV